MKLINFIIKSLNTLDSVEAILVSKPLIIHCYVINPHNTPDKDALYCNTAKNRYFRQPVLF